MSTRIGYYKKQYHSVDLVRNKEIVDWVTEIENDSKVYEIFLVMTRIGEEIVFFCNDAELSATEIQNLVHLSKPTVLGILTKLVDDGLLLCNRSLEDPHVWKYSLNKERQIDFADVARLYELSEQCFDNDFHTFALSYLGFAMSKKHLRRYSA